MLLDRVWSMRSTVSAIRSCFCAGRCAGSAIRSPRVPFRQGRRQHGVTKYSLRRMVELAVDRDCGAQRAAAALRGLAGAGVRRARRAAGDVLAGELPVRAAHGRWLDLDHGGDCDPRRGAAAGARASSANMSAASCARRAGGRTTWWRRPRRTGLLERGSCFSLSMILSKNRFPPRIKCGAGFFRIMLTPAP